MNKGSFFDASNLRDNFDFEKPLLKHVKEFHTQPLLVHSFSCRDLNSGITRQGIYALHGQLLVDYKDEYPSNPKAVLEVSYARIRPLTSTKTTINYGFVLTKNGSSFEFSFQEKEKVDEWLNALRSICIKTNFHDEYKAIKMIGKGGFASVYLVESKRNGQQYAVKTFIKEAITSSSKANAKAAIFNEIDILRALDHDHIMKLHEVHETNHSIYLVLELIQGKPLSQVISNPNFKKTYPETKVMEMLRSILDALSYLASKGIMHRDLKPSNMLLDKNGKIKIVDFGLATYINLPQYIYKKCGTPGYMAPEVFTYDQRNRDTFYNEKCDVFSAGCIFFYMLFGHPLFHGSDVSEIVRLNKQTIDLDPSYLVRKEIISSNYSEVNKEALALLYLMLEQNKRERISSAQAYNHVYFTPIMTKMTKISSSKEISNPSRRSSQSGGTPSITLKFIDSQQVLVSPRGEMSPVNSPKVTSIVGLAVPAKSGLNIEGSPIPSPIGGSPRGSDRSRFTERASLYLDVGKCDINGKIDTVSNVSHVNSVFHNKSAKEDKEDNDEEDKDHKSSFASQFANFQLLNQARAAAASKSKVNPKDQRRSLRVGQNHTILKAAIFNNMQKQNEVVNEETDESGEYDITQLRRHSEYVPPGGDTNPEWGSLSQEDDCEIDDVGEGSTHVQTVLEKFQEATARRDSAKLFHLDGKFKRMLSKKLSRGLNNSKEVKK